MMRDMLAAGAGFYAAFMIAAGLDGHDDQMLASLVLAAAHAFAWLALYLRRGKQ